MRRNDVASTSFRRRVPIRFLINQCQIITFLILKYDVIENSRIELRGIVLPVQMGGLFGVPKGMLAPLSNYWGACPPPPPPPRTPSSYAYAVVIVHLLQPNPVIKTICCGTKKIRALSVILLFAPTSPLRILPVQRVTL